MQRDFDVRITYKGKPLKGVRVAVTGMGAAKHLSTATDGSVHFKHLTPGNYWLVADFLGIGAAYDCFHIASASSRKAKHSLTYKWGEYAPKTSVVAGKLLYIQPGTGGTPIWNTTHSKNVPIIAARFELRSPISAVSYKTVSAEDGSFAFANAKPGTYVLHAEGGKAGSRTYDSTDQLIELSPRSTPKMVLLSEREPGGGSCGGTSMDLVNPPAVSQKSTQN